MWNRIAPVAVASGLFVAGSWAAGWIAAHAEYCQYGDYISVEKCDACELATLMVDAITWLADATLPMLILPAAVAACVLSCSLHKSNDALKRFVVVRGAQRHLHFTPRSPDNEHRFMDVPVGAKIGNDSSRYKSGSRPIIPNSVVVLELIGPDVMDSCSDKVAHQQPRSKSPGQAKTPPQAWREFYSS